MNPDDFIEIGYFQKPHGYKGQIGLALTVDHEILFNKVSFMMLEMNNLLTPFFIEKIETKHKILVKLENFNSDTEAKKFQSKKVFIHKDLVVQSTAEEEGDYTGYLLIDEVQGELGRIEGTEEMPGNDVFIILKNGKEILLPILEEFITEVDDEKKIIRYKAPEGLIDLYLE
ncbi:MAG: rRNA processing protein RimM [Bacteroidetes bacterium]|jgi:16S rRNA processing protein RimM|nr:rRNA processing protein RimM [Bacteroidota bacterium]